MERRRGAEVQLILLLVVELDSERAGTLGRSDEGRRRGDLGFGREQDAQEGWGCEGRKERRKEEVGGREEEVRRRGACEGRDGRAERTAGEEGEPVVLEGLSAVERWRLGWRRLGLKREMMSVTVLQAC